MFDFESKYKSVRHLLEEDARTPLAAEELDDQLWLLLSKRIQKSTDLENLPSVIGTYFASRYLQWEVGNGGFGQAAENIPEWFETAEAGYGALGKRKSAELIRKARALILSGDEEALVQLDSELPHDEWEIDEERVEFVRAHAAEFKSLRW
jgi:hypothetical protein